MFRKPAWRNTVSDAVGFHQDQALNTTIFLLKSYGPTGFLLKEEGEARNFKVCLGDPHTCSCPVFIKEQEPCKHICWVLLRKFRLPREHEYSFQHGLVERQISEVLHGLHQTKANRMENDSSVASGTSSQPDTNQEAGSVCRKVIQAQDVCPICQEELLEKKQPVSYCRFGCGNNVHISCMKVWADHQKLSDREETVKCPLCREDFGSLKLLQEQVKNAAKLFTAAEREKPGKHLGVLCNGCQVCPITGKCFKCIVCSYFYLCEDCSKKGCHPQHQFASRTKRGDKWHFVAEDLRDEPKGAASQSANDSIIPVAADLLPENVLGCLPTVRVRSGSMLLDEGQQCRICLQNFTLGHRVRTLPCNHKVEGPGWDGIRSPEEGVVSQRQTDLNGPTDLELLITRVQQDADGCHRLQLDASEHCRRRMLEGCHPDVKEARLSRDVPLCQTRTGAVQHTTPLFTLYAHMCHIHPPSRKEERLSIRPEGGDHPSQKVETPLSQHHTQLHQDHDCLHSRSWLNQQASALTTSCHVTFAGPSGPPGQHITWNPPLPLWQSALTPPTDRTGPDQTRPDRTRPDAAGHTHLLVTIA
uniref:Zinc finger, SWIM-type containing 2 n=1 Tax=Seriola dumerili TaxID=41447 RepID=A0A3B4UBF5_SERDU